MHPKHLILRLLLPLLLSSSLYAAKPNIVIILSDDQAWTDYSFMGHEQIDTPALDKLAAESLTYTRGYVAAPLCRPSLASIFTGLYPYQTGITGNDLLGKDGKKIPRTSKEGAAQHQQLYRDFKKHAGLAGLLKDAGYITMQQGKWWEGDPKTSGFQHALSHGDPARGARHGDKGLEISRKGIDATREFLDIAKKENKPFFLWHAPFLPHTPHTPPKALFEKYQKLVKSPHIARYYAMVEWFDQTCGELLGELDQRGLSDNTVIIFLTDNGWIQRPDSPRFAALSKQDVHEGGVRTPLTIKWPNHIKPVMDLNTPVSSIDIAPTLLKIAGVKVPAAMTGLDLRDRAALQKRNTVFGADHSHNIIGVDQRVANLESRYVVQGKWKLIVYNPNNFPAPKVAGKLNGNANNPEGKPELYDLQADPFEKVNLADKHPDRVAELRKELDGWWDGSAAE